MVFPAPLRPMMPHRSPRVTVKVTSSRRRVAPKSTAHAGDGELGHRPVHSRQVDSASPTVSRCCWRTRGIAEEQRLLDELVEPAILAQPGGAEAEIGEAPGVAVDQRLDAELLGEAAELAGRGRALLEVHEVGLDATLGEEAERLPRLGALPDAEDLDFHGAGI